MNLKFTCFTVMLGFQSFSSFKILKQTVPDGYTFGWNKVGVNLHFGCSKNIKINYKLSLLEGYSVENSTTLKIKN